jgi:hypothetical protein
MTPWRPIYLLFGFGCLALSLYALADPTFCESGCGNLTEPVFRVAYWLFGHWGTMILFAAAAFFFFWAATRRE